MTLKNLAAVAAIVLASGCQKKSNDAANSAAVNISIQNPAEAQTFHNGDTVRINAHVTYSSELHGYEVKITDTATGTVLFDNEEHAHKDAFDISETWAANVTAATNAILSVAVSVDHNGTVARKEVGIRIEP